MYIYKKPYIYTCEKRVYVSAHVCICVYIKFNFSYWVNCYFLISDILLDVTRSKNFKVEVGINLIKNTDIHLS
jgi:hypothetical protein